MKTKHSLLTSGISLLLCFVMLLGTTFAWFTDVATSSGNVIKTGNLDIALMKGTPNGNGSWTWTENNGEAIFDYENWEPGYTTWAGGHYNLITKVLRGEWGFNGFVLTDYEVGAGKGSYMDTPQSLAAGGDGKPYQENSYAKAR